MTDSDTNHRRYLRAAHAVQTGVGLELEHDPASGTPKHLRTGLNLSKAEHGALVRLLIERGLFTEAEYLAAIADAAEAEQHAYEERLTERYGGNTKVTLG